MIYNKATTTATAAYYIEADHTFTIEPRRAAYIVLVDINVAQDLDKLFDEVFAELPKPYPSSDWISSPSRRWVNKIEWKHPGGFESYIRG